MYLLSCDKIENGGGVYRYDAAFRQIGYLPCDRPMYAVRDGKRLHILLRAPFAGSDHSGYFSCDPDLGGATTPKDTLGVCACHVSVVDGDVYIVNYLSGNVVKNCEKAVAHEGHGKNLPRQDAPHTHFVSPAPDGKYILCTDLGLDTVFVYDKDLSERGRFSVPEGYGVRHLAFFGDTVYAVNELVPSVSVFRYETGHTVCEKTVMLPVKTAGATAAAIRVSPDGARLYLSVRGEDCVFVLRRETMEIEQKYALSGSGPRDMAFVGGDLVVCNEQSGTAEVLDAMGKLTPKRTFSLGKVLCVLPE